MKLKMKTMATILAAVLITMMGVMPALAVELNEVGLTAGVRAEIPFSIIATPDAITFDTTYEGQMVVGSSPISIVVAGEEEDFPFVLSASITEDPAFYSLGLDLIVGTDHHSVDTFLESVAAAETITVNLELTVPTGATIGSHTGTLVFWIEP